MTKKTFLTCSMAVALAMTSAQNPYLPLWEFIPDGEPYVFEDPDNPGKFRVYVYGSHDNLVTEYCGKDKVVWSASVDNLQEWRLDGIIFESKRDAKGNLLHPDGSGDVLYAPDVVEMRDADGKKVYYLYPNVQNGGRQTMVCRSNRPDGPFEACNWDPQKPNETVGPIRFDPAAFVDDDGRVYAYWGFERSYAAELDPSTMATVKAGTQIVEDMIPNCKQDKTFRFFEASSIRKIKDKYVFIYSRITNDGEEGLPATNYTLAYCYSNHPLGPWTYGGTLIDGRGKEKRSDGTTVPTACPAGNTHGSICQINGKWWLFYHRQAGTTEYSRQAMVAPIDVEVMEGESGYVRIKEAEFTSEGFATDGLDPWKRYAAGIACYFTAKQLAHQEYPHMRYKGTHIGIERGQYDGRKNPYDAAVNRCPMVDNNDGSVVGYKYFNFSRTFGKDGLKLSLNYLPEGTAGRMDIYIDRPSEQDGGVKIGSFDIAATPKGKAVEAKIPVVALKHHNGKHALFFVFSSADATAPICQLNDFCFEQ